MALDMSVREKKKGTIEDKKIGIGENIVDSKSNARRRNLQRENHIWWHRIDHR